MLTQDRKKKYIQNKSENRLIYQTQKESYLSKEKIANNFKKEYPNKKIKSLKHEITWMIPNKVAKLKMHIL